MAFSTGFGLTCMCFIMLLFLPGQGLRQFTKTESHSVAREDNLYPCCTNTSTGLIREPVDACIEQKEDILPCKLHAYIFVTRSNKALCVDPKARWLPDRLEKLKKRGITCKPFMKILHQPK